ncbi:MAG: hypothetical protein LBD66_00745 [Holosporales bacterium]|jgi:hypothetical protein|nr:hypothetical protein [Holosporales bacterium]
MKKILATIFLFQGCLAQGMLGGQDSEEGRAAKSRVVSALQQQYEAAPIKKIEPNRRDYVWDRPPGLFAVSDLFSDDEIDRMNEERGRIKVALLECEGSSGEVSLREWKDLFPGRFSMIEDLFSITQRHVLFQHEMDMARAIDICSDRTTFVSCRISNFTNTCGIIGILIKKKEATIINKSCAASVPTFDPNIEAAELIGEQCFVFSELVLYNQSTIQFFSAGNSAGFPCLNQFIHKGEIRSLSDMEGPEGKGMWTFFFVGFVESKKNDCWLKSDYPREGGGAGRYLVFEGENFERKPGGSSIATARASGCAAAMISAFPFLKKRTDILGYLFWATADLIKVCYNKIMTQEGRLIDPPELVYDIVRKVNLMRLFAFDCNPEDVPLCPFLPAES